MSQPALARMTPEEFFAWCGTQEERFELVDGVPVLRDWDPVRGMSGASRRHDQIVMNIVGELRSRLRGRACRPITADTAVRTGFGRRRLDAGVECGERQDGEHEANDPRVVFEVLSPSTRVIDLLAKLDEYKAVPGLAHIVIVEPESPDLKLWSRQAGGSWDAADVSGLEATLDLSAIEVSLPMSEIYDGLTFNLRPRVVAP